MKDAALDGVDRITAKRLRVEYLTDPLGIDVVRPRLGWNPESGRRGAEQSAYRIVVAGSPEKLGLGEGDLWDSGKVDSGESQHIRYAGVGLTSGRQAYWKVMVWDEAGEPGTWSEAASWTMGLLGRDEWDGFWIGRKNDRKPTREKPNPVVYLRRSFRLRGGIRRATVYATALGVYRLYANGLAAGPQLFAPEWTDYHARVQYQTYDVTALLREGDNALAAELGHGWYTGYIGMFGYQKYGMDPAFLLQLNVEYEDGGVERISTDESWRVSWGPIVASDLQMGETYDARLELPRWKEADCSEDGAWSEPDRLFDYRGRIVAQMTPPIRATEERSAAGVRMLDEDRLIVDAGQNLTGWLRVSLRGKSGESYTLKYAEAIGGSGEIYTDNLRLASQTDVFILGEDGPKTFETTFTCHGFRYVEISGAGAGRLAPGDIFVIVVRSALEETGRLETSDPDLNRLLDNIRWTQRSNFMGVPTDCPQRDERHGWTGDAQIFARTAAYNMDVSAFFAKWLTDLTDAQQPTGAFTDFAPFIFGPKTEFDNDFTYTHIGSAGWADAPPMIGWLLYETYGDTDVLRRCYPAFRRWIDYNEQLYPSGIRRDAPQYGDWLSVDERPFEETKAEFDWLVSHHSTTPYDVFATAYWVHGTKLMERIALAIGENEDAERYRALHARAQEAFLREFVSSEGIVKGDTQTAYAMALGMELLPESMRRSAADRLAAKIEGAGGMATTGFHGTKYLLNALCDYGYEELAFRLVLRREYPSWLYSVLQGATTIWERWDGWTEERGFQNASMNSLCHYAFGSVGEWLYRHVGGIDAVSSSPGFRRVRIRPRPKGGLTSASCEYDSLHGCVRTEWTARDGRFELRLRIPAGVTAVVYVPCENGGQVKESGIPCGEELAMKESGDPCGEELAMKESGVLAKAREAIRALGREDDCVRFLVGSGEYFFESLYETMGGNNG